MKGLEQNRHLMARAGFGISPEEFKTPKSHQETIEALFPKGNLNMLSIITPAEWNQYSISGGPSAPPDARRAVEKELKNKALDFNLVWLQEMVQTQSPLVEKMSLFWHGHFATQVTNPYFAQLLINDIRKNALTNFGDLLKAVSKSPAMLQFLNNQQNRKESPNENFAREVMELFTLGRGYYTETDIKEAARAFTGWGFNQEGEFVFRKNQHDDGSKTFLGKTGNFNGDDILNILLEQKQTARFITGRLYRFLVTDEEMDPHRIEALAARFYQSNYNTGALLREIFSADWFYSKGTVGAKIKSPVELLVGYQRTIPHKFKESKTLLMMQQTLGQMLFYPPNVGGWPGGRDWIDSSRLVLRLSLPEALFASKELNLSAKEIDAEMNDPSKKPLFQDAQPEGHFQIGQVDVSWDAYLSFWRQYSKDQLPQALAGYLLNTLVSQEKVSEVGKYADTSSPENYIKSLSILFMKMPEFQLS